MITNDQAIALLRKAVEEADSMNKFCETNRLFTSEVCQALNGKRSLSANIMAVLGYSKVTGWVKKQPK